MTNELIPQAVEINCQTGEEVYRALTEEELAQREADATAYYAEVEAKQAADAARAAAKASAQTKLAELGLTPEEIAAL
jgi:DNA-binding transcriptional regulator YhcF (GntR family)